MTAFLGIETGGTKIVARLVNRAGDLLAGERWPTGTPEQAADQIVRFTRASLPAGEHLAAAGLAAFGPLILDIGTGDAGRMLATAKPGWTGSNLRAALASQLGVPVAVDTDVNAAALAEKTLEAGDGCPTVAYLTIGTGIGAGLATAAGTLAGAMHPEIGHLRLIRESGDIAPSVCPFHADCAEGLAAGPAVARRLRPDERLEQNGEIGSLVARYVAQLAAALVLAWSPHRIVLGGGVMTAEGMLERTQDAFAAMLGDYGVGPLARDPRFLAAAVLADAGLEGALLMGRSIA